VKIRFFVISVSFMVTSFYYLVINDKNGVTASSRPLG
jgi:hypothetical protein